MIDLIVFKVGTNRYALNIEYIQRIIQAEELTHIPSAHKYIDGMMSYEDRVMKVLNFRKLIGVEGYDEELKVLFAKLKAAHGEWVESLKTAIYTGSAFTKTTNPHMCELGKWIDSFTSYDDSVAIVFSELVNFHKQLHLKGGDILDMNERDQEEAKRMVDVDINNIYGRTMGALDTFIQKLDIVANSLQKLIIYENDDKVFAIKVDSIEDISHVREDQIMNSSENDSDAKFLKLDGVLDLDGVLINLIKTVTLPS
mgnify:CR=1 FL=1